MPLSDNSVNNNRTDGRTDGSLFATDPRESSRERESRGWINAETRREERNDATRGPTRDGDDKWAAEG